MTDEAKTLGDAIDAARDAKRQAAENFLTALGMRPKPTDQKDTP